MVRLLRTVQTVSRFMQMDHEERWLIVEAGLYLVCAKLATLATPARTLISLGCLPASPAPPPAQLPQDVRDAASALEQSSLYLGFDNCLVRALALRMLLARREIPTVLHIGARKDEEGEFAAHAWLTYRGCVLVGGEDAPGLYRELVGAHDVVLQ